MLEVVPTVDLERYQGTWYEIARLPNRFQDECDGEVTATYTLREDGRLDVLNTCARDGRSPSRAEGIARRAGEDGPEGKLEVRFAPAFLGWLPFVWGDYWILELDPEYTHALVGSPDRKYLWILAREPGIDPATLERLRLEADRRGFEVERLRMTRQRDPGWSASLVPS